ncbi:MAG: phenylalanine--tRNA ligase subunit beta [Clostridiales bacterium]|nr:phenylalanine--tRNA ligase subunit beta [Clostridiales bacterium]
MKTSMNWLRQYTDIPHDNEVFQQKMIMTGTAVESIQDLGAEIDGVVVGLVHSCLRHENSDHLHVCQVDVGEDKLLQIVCGAPNVKEGILVPTAIVGAKLPGGFDIKQSTIRGVESSGMLCSATELDVPVELYPSVGEAGLLIFNEDYPLGSDVKPIFGFDDSLVDVEVLANRPDCLSVWGLAREAAAVLDLPFKLPQLQYREDDDDSIDRHVKISVQNSELCPRYAGRVVKNVRIGSSPLWLRRYLHTAGMRSINNIVDITNFVMLETGHPMHAFDLDQVKGQEIIVRQSQANEKITTLDGKQHNLSGSELLICDQEGAIGLAGIMGGLDSEIEQTTQTLLFECAAFDRSNTRLTARALGIRTEASSRFERGVNPQTVLTALDRACHLVEALGAGEIVSGIIDIYPHPLRHSAIAVSVSRISQRAGVDIGQDEMVSILERLHFDVSKEGEGLQVTAPDFRQDVEQEADICEEVLRLAGYDRIPSTLMKGEAMQGFDSQNRIWQQKLARILNGLGYDEIINYSFFGQKQLDSLGLNQDDARHNTLHIRNPLGEDTTLMRSSLAPAMLKTLALNMQRSNETAKLYEFGTIFDAGSQTQEGLFAERSSLCLGCYGKEESFYTLRDTVISLLLQEGISYSITAYRENYLHPGRSAAITAGDMILARVGEVHPKTALVYEMDKKAYLAELDLEAIQDAAVPMAKIKELPRMPAVSRDVALVLENSQELLPVMEAIRRAGGALLEDINLFDVYRGAQLDEGKKSAAFSLVFRAMDRSLEEKEIAKLMDKVKRSVKVQFGADVRS